MSEADLDRHLANPNGKDKDAADGRRRKVAEKPPHELRYLLDEKEDAVARALKRDAAREAAHDDAGLSAEQLEDEEIDADPDQVKEDYQIRFARELLTRAPFPDRPRLLEAAGVLVGEKREEEARRLEARLGQLGLDWSAGADKAGTPRAVVTVTPVAGRAQKAGETVPWTVTVENRGDAPFRRLRAWTTSDKNGLLDRREFVFGTVRPGERRSWTVPVKLPRSLDSRRDEVTLHFDDEHGKAPADVATSLDVVETPRPIFAFSVQVDDRKGGNGDGLPQRGETFTLRIDVKNAGPGQAGEKTFVSLKNLGDEKLFIKKGREVLGALRPGESKGAAMEIELKRGSRSETLPVRVQILDEKTGEYVSEKLELAISPSEAPVVAESGAVSVAVPEALVRGGAGAEAPVVAVARKGAVLPASGAVSGWKRVEWQKGRFGFVAAGEVTAARGARAGAISEAWQREPPRITLSPDPARGGPVVDAASFRLSGSASVPPSADPDARLRDVFIYVNDTKVFFRVVPEGAAASRLEFTSDLPLKPGPNTVTVWAREDQEFMSRRSMVIFRRPPAEVAEGGTPARSPTRTP
jgi:carboxyl-terminal processing protease